MNNKISLEFEVKLEKAIQSMKTASSMVKIMSNNIQATKTSFKSASNQLSMFSTYNAQLKSNLESISGTLKTYRAALTRLEKMDVKGPENKQLQEKAINKYKEAISVLVKEQAKEQAQLKANTELEKVYSNAGVKSAKELKTLKEEERQATRDAAKEKAEAIREEKRLNKEAKEEEKRLIKEANEAKKKADDDKKKSEKEALEKIKIISESIKKSFSDVGNNISKVVSGIKKLESGFEGLLKSGVQFGKTLEKNFIEKAMDYSEELNLFNVVFDNIEKNGETTFSKLGKRATQFQNELNETFGTNKMETMKYQGLYQSMSESAGLSKKYSYIMSESMTKLGYDLASLYNTSEQKAMESLRAGVYAGQTKPLRGYGIDVTQQTYKPILADLGIDKTVSQLSQAEKEILRYIATVKQASAANSDFANTIESPANQLKVLKNQITELAVSIGNFFIKPFQRAIQVINGVAMALKAIIKAIGDLFGVGNNQFNSGNAYADGLDDYSDGMDDIGDSVSDTTNKMKELNRQTLGFDQINNISSPNNTSSGSNGGGNYGVDQRLLDAMSEYESRMKDVKMRAVEIRDTIMEWLGFTKEVNSETKETTFKYDTIGKSLQTIVTEISGKIADGLNKLTNDFDWAGYGEKLGKGINTVLAGLNTFIAKYDWKNLGSKIASFLNNAIQTTDFKELGKTLTNKLRIAILSLAGFLETFDYKNFAKKIAEGINGAIENIPIDELTSSINIIVDTIFEIIKEIDWGKLIDTVFEVIKGLDWDTKLLILAPFLFNGISALLKVVFTSLVNSGKLTELIGGLFTKGGLFGAGGGVATLGSKIFGGIKSGLEGLGGAATSLAGKIGMEAGASGGLIGAFIALDAVLVTTAISTAKETIPKIKDAKKTIEETTVSIKNTTKNIKEGNKELVESAKNTKIDTKAKQDLANNMLNNIKENNDFNTSLQNEAKWVDKLTGKWDTDRALMEQLVETNWGYIETLGEFYSQGALTNEQKNEYISLVETEIKRLQTANEKLDKNSEEYKNNAKKIDILKEKLDGVQGEHNIDVKTKADTSLLDDINLLIGDITGNHKIKIDADTLQANKAIKNFIKKIGKNLFGVIFPDLVYDKIIAKFSTYANGGMPKTGELFFANEAGPELVGRIGNRTAVANNDQIVSAIRSGVYDAVSSAMSNANGGSVELVLHTDEGVVVDRINKITRQTGVCPINI